MGSHPDLEVTDFEHFIYYFYNPINILASFIILTIQAKDWRNNL